MKLPSITTRVFIAVLATATLVAVATGFSMRISFDRGFIGFLNEQAVLRMNFAVPRLAQAYAEHRNWDFVRDHRDVWFGLLGANLTLLPPGADPSAVIPDPVATDLLGAGRRMTLLDAQRQHVIGFPYILATSVERPILVDGATVGYIA